MKTVYIVGAGMNARSITGEGIDAVKPADALFGSPRLLEAFAHLGKPSYPLYKPDDILREIQGSEKSAFAALVSGDVGFFSGAAALYAALAGFDARLIPGISSMSAFSAKLGIPWQGFKIVSMHGLSANIAEHVRRNPHVFCLTGGNAPEIGRALEACGLGDACVHVGENLGYENERILKMPARELCDAEFAPLTILLIVNEDFDNSIRFGIPDDEFSRMDGIPMTKSEVRAVISARLNLFPGAVCYDIGAGTGSVTVEMALAAYEGRVFAIEQNKGALPLISENLLRFNIGNAAVVYGAAPASLDGLPAPDAAFIGGSGGELAAIISALVKKNPRVRIVASAVSYESAAIALSSLESVFSDVEAMQINVSRSKAVGKLHMMTALNPVTILSGGGL